MNYGRILILSNLMIILMKVSCFYRYGYMAPKYQTKIIQNIFRRTINACFQFDAFSSARLFTSHTGDPIWLLYKSIEVFIIFA